ncbi:L-lactate dehydrogenase complex protein LldG [Chitinophaga jiangningensis]|uniref:L-lactate dehydrogenase complex protein LldG n=1 Tax=Chitinophaga jiangningensis TaxID=1419482 RepID=A0A1M7M422_9BACT|nr:LUD domain-containing protein [Chitinophaga jiangningensis]SHM84966.1 L-lactate dehydrogenase complex protein LldG [Chitinophaga jiangningensis]
MSSRDNILNAVKRNQPESSMLPSLKGLSDMPDSFDDYKRVVEGLGAVVEEVVTEEDIIYALDKHLPERKRTVDTRSAIQQEWIHEDAHLLEDVDVALIPGQLAVAENGAVWLTEHQMKVRALPFITQHLVLIISRKTIVATMHEAYEKIGGPETGFGVFIAGPSKTADIEQSLVLGAHGAKSLLVLVTP